MYKRCRSILHVALILLVSLMPAFSVRTFLEQRAEAQTTAQTQASDSSARAEPDNAMEAPEPKKQKTADDYEDSKRNFETINLSIGTQFDKKLSSLPSGYSLKGDYRAVTSIEVIQNTRTLRFKPKESGVATLTVHDKSGRVVFEFKLDVKKSSIDKVMAEIKELLKEIEGIEIKIVNNMVVVDGQVLLPNDLSRIYIVISHFPQQASQMVKMSPIAWKKYAEIIERDINNPEITVRAVNDTIILEGKAGSKEERQKAFDIAQIYLPSKVLDPATGTVLNPFKKEPVVNFIDVRQGAPAPPAKIIQVAIHYVELNKDYNSGFRILWNPSISDGSSVNYATGSNQPGGMIGSITGVISNLLPKLNWAKEHGHARVLESTSIIVENGKRGELNSLSHIPYTVIGKDTQVDTKFQDVGITTIVTPALLSENSDSINLDLNFKIRSYLGEVRGMPMTSENSIQTNIMVRSGQSAAIGGLISNSQSVGYNRMPSNQASKGDPLLTLLNSKDFTHKQSQFVVFVTPIIKISASAGVEKIKKKFRVKEQ